MKRKETVEEFLARGGEITQITQISQEQVAARVIQHPTFMPEHVPGQSPVQWRRGRPKVKA